MAEQVVGAEIDPVPEENTTDAEDINRNYLKRKADGSGTEIKDKVRRIERNESGHQNDTEIQSQLEIPAATPSEMASPISSSLQQPPPPSHPPQLVFAENVTLELEPETVRGADTDVAVVSDADIDIITGHMRNTTIHDFRTRVRGNSCIPRRISTGTFNSSTLQTTSTRNDDQAQDGSSEEYEGKTEDEDETDDSDASFEGPFTVRSSWIDSIY